MFWLPRLCALVSVSCLAGAVHYQAEEAPVQLIRRGFEGEPQQNHRWQQKAQQQRKP